MTWLDCPAWQSHVGGTLAILSFWTPIKALKNNVNMNLNLKPADFLNP